MGKLDGRVAIITGAGRGIGREHALLFAREGAKVVVNDLAMANDEGETGSTAADAVVGEIRAAGGRASAINEDVSTWGGARRVVEYAIAEYGEVHVLVNNAGILRDAFIVDITEDGWDDVIAVNLKSHAALLHHAARHWRKKAKSGQAVAASVINTSSGSGTQTPLLGEVNYGASKAGILALTQVAALELSRYGVRVNAINPFARTRLTLAAPSLHERLVVPETGIDHSDPAQVSPFAAFLAQVDCPLTGRVFAVQGGRIDELSGWHTIRTVESQDSWTIDRIRAIDWG